LEEDVLYGLDTLGFVEALLVLIMNHYETYPQPCWIDHSSAILPTHQIRIAKQNANLTETNLDHEAKGTKCTTAEDSPVVTHSSTNRAEAKEKYQKVFFLER
jgi:hypothetical protein